MVEPNSCGWLSLDQTESAWFGRKMGRRFVSQSATHKVAHERAEANRAHNRPENERRARGEALAGRAARASARDQCGDDRAGEGTTRVERAQHRGDRSATE